MHFLFLEIKVFFEVIIILLVFSKQFFFLHQLIFVFCDIENGDKNY